MQAGTGRDNVTKSRMVNYDVYEKCMKTVGYVRKIRVVSLFGHYYRAPESRPGS